MNRLSANLYPLAQAICPPPFFASARLWPQNTHGPPVLPLEKRHGHLGPSDGSIDTIFAKQEQFVNLYLHNEVRNYIRNG
jgi:hypothetical protein